VEAISKPHYVGSQEHEVVANYLIKELNKLGLETTVQQGYAERLKSRAIKKYSHE
jgi:hypothetical protein